MSTLDEMADKVRRAIALIDQARDLLAAALAELDDALADWRSLLHGSNAPEAWQVVGGLRNALDTIHALVSALNQAQQMVNNYLDRLGVTTTPTTDAPISPPLSKSTNSPQRQPTSASPGIPDKLVEALRGELPPPIRRDDRGRKTHGRWISEDGVARKVVSGEDIMSQHVIDYLHDMGLRKSLAVATDVEMKLAAYMRKTATRHVTVVINNTPCRGPLSCDTLVPVLLPRGYTLIVHGTTEQQTKFRKEYTGGATPQW